MRPRQGFFSTPLLHQCSPCRCGHGLRGELVLLVCAPLLLDTSLINVWLGLERGATENRLTHQENPDNINDRCVASSAPADHTRGRGGREGLCGSAITLDGTNGCHDDWPG
ncbi:hypothetical protein DPEC_G00336430 [Dallia pectoralis]|uniref:Uncharacterized protein n=1 Tax=Dallia pectoralis TaxID=75939 RepID=A0ACC2F7F7_DALPE|nr:hypothetical protein DPEC_G00336430 [Dallia pectoralis]